MSIRLLTLSLCLLITVANSACAQSQGVSRAELNKIAESHRWLKLGRWSKTLFGDYESRVTSDSFFVSRNGSIDPKAELVAFVASFSDFNGQDDHPICRFPARYYYVAEQADIRARVDPDEECRALSAWTDGVDASSVSMVYATGYLGNPASYYGHTLIKFNKGNHNPLLDRSINYGVIEFDRGNPVAYIVKSLTGMYDAGFSEVDFHFHSNMYGESELRNMWEYELNLTPDEVRYLAFHAWELVGKKFKYFFFKENCVYRTAEFFDVLPGMDLANRKTPWFIPQSLVIDMDSRARDNVNLVRSRRFHPSRQDRFEQKFRQLTNHEKALLETVIKSEKISGEMLASLGGDTAYRIIDSALDYFQYRIKTDPLNSSFEEEKYRVLIENRFARPAKKSIFEFKNITLGPEKSRSPSYVSSGMKATAGGRLALMFRVRAAYYDLLDYEEGMSDEGSLIMGDLKARIDDSGVKVDSFTVFEVTSLPQSDRFDDGPGFNSWAIAVELESSRSDCNSTCLSVNLRAMKGVTTETGLGNFTVLAGMGYSGSNDNRGGLYGGAELSILSRINTKLSLRASYSARSSLERDFYYSDLVNIAARIKISRNADFRIELAHWDKSSLTASLGYYW